MPRRPADKPWFHEASGFYCVTFNGKRHYLDRGYKLACRKLIPAPHWILRHNGRSKYL